MKNRKRIYIIDSYSKNTGDIGILMATVSSLKKEIPGVRISIQASHPSYLKKYPELAEYPIFPRIFDIENIDAQINPIVKIGHFAISFFDSVTFIMWALLKKSGFNSLMLVRKKRRKQALALDKTDLIFSSGGGFLSTNYYYNLRLYMYAIGLILKKPIFIFSQSIGPFKSRISQIMIPFFLKRCKLVSVREPKSLAYIRKFGISGVIQVADIAFQLRTLKIRQELRKQLSGNLVAICVMDAVNKKHKKAYFRAMEFAIKHLKEIGYFPILVSQTESDNKTIIKLTEAVGGGIAQALFGLNPKEVKKLYSQCEFVIAFRMHAIIFACESGTPFISVGYEPKFQGLMKMLDYDKRLILNKTNINEKSMLKSIKFMIKNRAQIVKKIRKQIPGLKRQATYGVSLVKNYLNQ